MAKGYLSLILHAHLPYVRHPEKEYFLEENWLFEAITDTYIPLIEIFDRLLSDGISFRITMSLTPTLVSMLRDEMLKQRYIRHIDRLIELSAKEVERTRFLSSFHEVAKMYYDRFVRSRYIFINRCKQDLVSVFKSFQDNGCLEIIASAATHAFLPLLDVNPRSVYAQVKLGVDYYFRIFGQNPRGIWLPECGYAYGIDNILCDCGLRYFFAESHGVVNADPTPRYGVYAPIYTPSGVAVFGRDWESSKQVWSAEEGYPGDTEYREYYRDIGFELDLDYLLPYIDPSGIRVNTGIKYWRITGKSYYKQVYRPEYARRKAYEHAEDFLNKKIKQINSISIHMDRIPIIVAPYDAELFGHWWFEGPLWLEALIRKASSNDEIKLITASDYLNKYTVNQVALPSPSSWGRNGYNEFWIDKENDWIYPHLHKAGERISELVQRFLPQIQGSDGTDRLIKRALNQVARELLLAQASDWPFIMKAGTTVAYANKRIREHISRFTRLYDDLMNNNIDERWLSKIEAMDNIFGDIDCIKYFSNENVNKPDMNATTVTELLSASCPR